jgi:hypothetical protein
LTGACAMTEQAKVSTASRTRGVRDMGTIVARHEQAGNTDAPVWRPLSRHAKVINGGLLKFRGA